jgi:hypothetical protein
MQLPTTKGEEDIAYLDGASVLLPASVLSTVSLTCFRPVDCSVNPLLLVASLWSHPLLGACFTLIVWLPSTGIIGMCGAFGCADFNNALLIL